jgi:DNA-binding response OmpR family regulator
MEKPFDQEEIQHAIRAGRRRKDPEMEGLIREFYAGNWNLLRADMINILNQTFWEGKITKNQKHGMIICLPKVRDGNTTQEYRPITLLNTDYKILARMIVRRQRPLLDDHLTSIQYCGVPGNSILDAAATICDTIAYAENKGIPLCVLSRLWERV